MKYKKQINSIVVGSGFGGIASALRLRSLGHNVTIIEKLNKIGGRAQVFNVDGFKHDAGPTVITAPFMFDELFNLFGENRKKYLNFVSLDPWYRFYFHDKTYFDYCKTVKDTKIKSKNFPKKMLKVMKNY